MSRWHVGGQPSCRWLARRGKAKSVRPMPFPLLPGESRREEIRRPPGSAVETRAQNDEL